MELVRICQDNNLHAILNKVGGTLLLQYCTICQFGCLLDCILDSYQMLAPCHPKILLTCDNNNATIFILLYQNPLGSLLSRNNQEFGA